MWTTFYKVIYTDWEGWQCEEEFDNVNDARKRRIEIEKGNAKKVTMIKCVGWQNA